MKASSEAKNWTTDQVANCLEGVPMDLRNKLENLCVDDDRNVENYESPSEWDEGSPNRLDKHWKALTEDEQVLLNTLLKVPYVF